MRLLRPALLVGLSIALHAAIVAIPLRRAAPPPEPPKPPLATTGVAAAARRSASMATVLWDRERLIAKARADRDRGALDLGAFLIEGEAIDAREEGRTMNRAEASSRYRARVSALRDALAKDQENKRDVPKIVAEVFSDMHYIGRPGGAVSDALLEGGGSCEPLAQLIASCLFDAGLGDRAFLRYYGGDTGDGVTHLAPIYREKKGERDLLTGKEAIMAGSAFAAKDLIEAYERAHAPHKPPPSRSSKEGSARSDGGDGEAQEGAPKKPAQRTLALGYPENRDKFPGALPMFSLRAVSVPGKPNAPAITLPTVTPAALAEDCAFTVRLAELDPPTAFMMGGEGSPSGVVELHKRPSAGALDRTFSLIQAVEQTMQAATVASPLDDRVDRVMALACLTVLYARAGLDFALVGEDRLAERAVTRGKDASAEGKALLDSLGWQAGPTGDAVMDRLTKRWSGRGWLLVALPGGEGPSIRLAHGMDKSNWSRVRVLAALAVAPASRESALEIVEALPVREQIEVMHEVFRAHDHMKPWASSYAIEAGWTGRSKRPFARAYRVFRGVAWGLWEGVRPAEETLDWLVAASKREGLGDDLRGAMISYYAHHALNLHRVRPSKEAFLRSLWEWLRKNGYGDMDLEALGGERPRDAY